DHHRPGHPTSLRSPQRGRQPIHRGELMSDSTFGFSLPDTLPTDPAALHELRAQAIDAYEKANPGDGVVPSPEQLDEMKAIVAALDKIDAALATAEEA